MFIIKKILFIYLLAVILILPTFAYALVNSIQSLSIAIANVFWIVFTAIAVIMFVISGILFLTAMGDAEKIKTARLSFIWGVVGVIVGIVAYSIINIMTSVLS
jgi:hypothetical protein